MVRKVGRKALAAVAGQLSLGSCLPQKGGKRHGLCIKYNKGTYKKKSDRQKTIVGHLSAKSAKSAKTTKSLGLAENG